MATPADIDPATLAAIRAQLSGQPMPSNGGGGDMGGGPNLSLPPALQARLGLNQPPQAAPQAPLTDTERMLSGGLEHAGVPRTQAPHSTGAPQAAGQVQGDFVQNPATAPGAPAQMPPMTATPARSISTVSPETRGMYEGAMQNKLAAPNEEAAATAASNEHQAALLDQQIAALGKQQVQADAERKKRSEALDVQMADYKRLQDEAANDKVDPDRWWGNKSSGAQALGLIGIILSGIGGGISGHGGNVAIDLMNKMIDRDVDSQKANISGKQHRADAAMNIYSQKLRQFGDEGAADMATRAQMLEQFKLQAQAEALRSQSPILQARAKDISAQIQLEQAKLHQGLEQWHQAGVAGGMTPEDQKRAFELYSKQLGLTPEQAKQAALSIRGVAPSTGLPALTKPGSKSPEDKTAEALAASGANPPAALSTGERITAGLSHLPLVGRAFQGTEGARKELAQEAGNFPAMAYAHKAAGARTPEQQEHVAAAFLTKPSDSQERINQKYNLRRLVKAGTIDEDVAVKLLERDEDEESEK